MARQAISGKVVIEGAVEKTLQELFEGFFRGARDFAEFTTFQMEGQYSEVPWGERRIYKPSPLLKSYHRFLSSMVLRYLPVNERVSFAYRKGVSVRDALIPHVGNKFFFQADLRNFFSSISVELVADTLGSMEAPIRDLNDHVDRISALVTVSGSLPIGFSTSPLISNACLIAFDFAFDESASARGLVYTRYADDIIISTENEGALEDVESLLVGTLRERLGDAFKINWSKVRRAAVGRKVSLLGMTILPNGLIAADRSLREKVEYLLHFYRTDRRKFIDALGGDERNAYERMSGFISHLNSLDSRSLDKLRRKYGAVLVDAFLHRSIQ